jgi:stage III sporulation protein AG
MFKNKLKQLVTLKEEEGNNKKKVENIVVFIIILIVTIIAINFILSDKKETTKSENNTSNKRLAITNQNEVSSDNTENTESLSEKLEYILSKISGVGDVNVFINYSQSSEMVAMYNENSKSSSTEETDTSGGIRKIEETDAQKEIVYQENNGEKTPITQKIVKPKIEGAIITAKGASNVNVKTNIIQAVEAATGLATHKIQVFEMK